LLHRTIAGNPLAARQDDAAARAAAQHTLPNRQLHQLSLIAAEFVALPIVDWK
jgi:hypothetical protein